MRPPVRVADLPAGSRISYGPTFVARRRAAIATLPVGYGDGWPRTLSNRAARCVRGRRVPLVGNVAMDAVMVDVTDVPGAPVTVDDEFVLLGSPARRPDRRVELARDRAPRTRGRSWPQWLGDCPGCTIPPAEPVGTADAH